MSQRTVIVTGASLGIGRAAAIAFARRGDAVALVARDAERGEAVAREISGAGGEAAFVRADVSDEEQVRAMVDRVVARWDRVDVLVNNAGVYVQADVIDTTREAWDKVLATNLTGAFLCIRHAVPAMRGGGVVVNVSSEAGLVGIAGQVAYNVSKSGLIGLTRSCAVDLATRGVRVNCVCPGTTDTPLVEAALARSADPVTARRSLEEARPLGRLGRPDEIASAIVYAASEDAAYMTGAVISIDGGYTAR
jgi:NAD(P)-dependent dehydrogenase (short-subunit alcohol dehydrogenase family)